MKRTILAICLLLFTGFAGIAFPSCSTKSDDSSSETAACSGCEGDGCSCKAGSCECEGCAS